MQESQDAVLAPVCVGLSDAEPLCDPERVSAPELAEVFVCMLVFSERFIAFPLTPPLTIAYHHLAPVFDSAALVANL